MEPKAGLGCRIRLFEANECSESLDIAVLQQLLNHSDALYLPTLTENLSKVLFFVVVGEVLNEEVALLLRILVAE